MESEDAWTAQRDASGPSIGFPVGTAILLIVIFMMSGIISCCYHWHKLRSFRHSHTSPLSSSSTLELKEKRGQSLPVLMPGDEVPKFVAMPCPCQPPKIIVTIHNPTPPPTPKSPPFSLS